MNIAILFPTMGRPALAAERAGQMLANHGTRHKVRAFFAVPESDTATQQALEGIANSEMVIRPGETTAVEGWNMAYQAAFAWADWFVLGADDVVWRKDWLRAALKCGKDTGEDTPAVIGFNDGYKNPDDIASHYMVTKAFTVDVLGGVMCPPGYRSWSFDREIVTRAKALDAYTPCHEATIDHLHPEWDLSAMDATYRSGYPFHIADANLCERRRLAGWPSDWESLVSVTQDTPYILNGKGLTKRG